MKNVFFGFVGYITCEDGHSTDDDEDVEDSRSENCSEANRGSSHEDAKERGGELRCRGPSSHECGTSHIWRQIETVPIVKKEVK